MAPVLNEISHDPGAEFYLLGSGIFSFLDMTLLTQHLLTTRCKSVYYLHELPSLERFLLKICPQAQNLMPVYYLEGRDRSEIYDDIVRHVIQTPQEKRPAALLLHGHPLVYSTISQRLIRECKGRKIALEIVPGVSSLDRMFVDLQLDIADGGVQIFPAAGLILSGKKLDPTVGCFLLQIGSLNAIAARKELAKKEEVERLKGYLINFYPEGHLVKIMECAVEMGFQSRGVEIEIKNLTQAEEYFDYNATLYIPPLRS